MTTRNISVAVAAAFLLLAVNSTAGQGLALPAPPADNDYYDGGSPDAAKVQLGAQLFFWGRVAHAVVYIAGVPYVRTLVFGASIVGLFQILSQLF